MLGVVFANLSLNLNITTMKKGAIILGSIIGGAILGSAVTICLKSKSGKDMRRMAHQRILEELDHLHDHIKGCSCMTGGECDCECHDTMDQMAKMGEEMKEKVAAVKDAVVEKVAEAKSDMKGKMGNMSM